MTLNEICTSITMVAGSAIIVALAVILVWWALDRTYFLFGSAAKTIEWYQSWKQHQKCAALANSKDVRAMDALRAAARNGEPAMVSRATSGWGAMLSDLHSGPYRADDPADAILKALAATDPAEEYND